MKNIIQDYAWGSLNAIPELLGYDNPEKIPQAELWMGSHNRGPSRLIDGDDSFLLSEYINEQKDEILGSQIAAAYGDLPFLFKVLAAGSPLSIQVHPNKSQAEAGFQRENSQSVPLDAFNRNYKDDNHKPEIICALTDFWALRGFRTIDSIIAYFTDVDLPVFSSALNDFSNNRTSEGLQDFFNKIMSLDGKDKEDFINQLMDAVSKKEGPVFDWIKKLYEKYPEDAAIAAPLYLNLVHLNPGEALYLAAGELHAYIDGLGMELMASSDNVLRGGLTPKFIDREELKNILNFVGSDPEILNPMEISPIISTYRTPSREFELSRITLTSDSRYNPEEKGEVQILFVNEGVITLASEDSESLVIRKGESVFIPQKTQGWLIHGEAIVYRASLPAGD